MGKNVRKGKLETITILFIVCTLLINVLPLQGITLHAQEQEKTTLQVEKGQRSHTLTVSTQDALAAEAVLMQDGVRLESRFLQIQQEAVFTITQNGSYQLQSLDAAGSVLEEKELQIDDLQDLIIEKKDDRLDITTRDPGTKQIEVTWNDRKEQLPVKKAADGLLEAAYQPKENGSYTFVGVDADGHAIQEPVRYEVSDIPKKAEKKTEADEAVIHIRDEQGLRDIAKAPEKTYILDADIRVQSDTVMISETFRGTLDGRGHVIRQLKQPLFSSLDGATIKHVVLQSEIERDADMAALAIQAEKSTIEGVGIQAEITSSKTAAGMLVHSSDTQIKHCFVNADIQAADAAGFIAEGTAVIQDSYVTGIVEANRSAYGFGRDTDLENCYAAVYTAGKSGKLFSEGKLHACFYDNSVVSMIEEDAKGYTNAQMVSDTLAIEGFQQKKGSYPTLPKKITDTYSEQAEKLSALSTLAVTADTSLLGLSNPVQLPATSGKEDITWNAEGSLQLTGHTLQPTPSYDLAADTTGTLIAETSSGKRTLKAASVKLLQDDQPIAGRSLAEKTTSITFAMQAGHYYLITRDGTKESNLPADHKAAIEEGWKRYIWDGVITWDDLQWNTQYYLYDYDVKGDGSIIRHDIHTVKGKLKGTVELSGELHAGVTLQAVLSDANTTKGTWLWEQAASPSASDWTLLKEESTAAIQTQKSRYTIREEDSGSYIRVSFRAEDDTYAGTISTIGRSPVKTMLQAVGLYKDALGLRKATEDDMVVDTTLYAITQPFFFDDEVDYTWFHCKADGSEEAIVQVKGSSYQLSGRDVGKKICVRAVGKETGRAGGMRLSEPFAQSVQAAETAPPKIAPQLADDADTSIDDTSVTVRMPQEAADPHALYQFAYQKETGGGVLQEVKEKARGSNAVTITGLTPRTSYRIYVRIIGEDGHLDSSYALEHPLTITTTQPHVKGHLDIIASGDYRYGSELKAVVTDAPQGQSGTITWYLLQDDGKKEEVQSGDTITLQDARYVGHRLEAVYRGNKDFSKELRIQSEIIKKQLAKTPAEALIPQGAVDDHSLKVKLPAAGSDTNIRYQIGYTTTENAVPKLYEEDGEGVRYAPGDEAIIKGLKRNTAYYLFLRYASSDTMEKSNWTADAQYMKTEKTPFDGALYFTYGSAGTAPRQGERLSVRLGAEDDPANRPNTNEGIWTWYKTDQYAERVEIENFFPEEDGYATYYDIPETDEEGTIYTVRFQLQEDYTKKLEGGKESNHVEYASAKLLRKQEPGKMDAPDASQLQEISATDTTITFRMQNTTDLIYAFCYSESDDIATAKEVANDAYAQTNVTIKGLKRNTPYHIWVRVRGDNGLKDSDWSDKKLTVSTTKTSLLGYVELTGSDTVGQPMQAVYHSASYMPQGLDTGGSWQWYQETDDGVFAAIPDASQATYTPKTAEIGRRLKVEYRMAAESAFTGHKEAVTGIIKKQLAQDPVIEAFERAADTDRHKPSLRFTLDRGEGVWYRIQKETEQAPENATKLTSEQLQKAGWTACTKKQYDQITSDHQGEELQASTRYTLYVVKPETLDTQASNLIDKTTAIDTLQQTGSITIKNTMDVSVAEDGSTSYQIAPVPVVGNTLTASLQDANNLQGTWNWYISKADCGNDGSTPPPDTADTGQWEQLSGGYSPTMDSDLSTLTLSEDMWKHYIRVEFVPNRELGYVGDSIQAGHKDFIKRIYDEELSIQTKTKAGTESVTVYPQSTLTLNVQNWSKEELKDRLTLYIGNELHDTAGFIYDGNTLTATEGNWPQHHEKEIRAELKVPKDSMLYVDREFQDIPADKVLKSEAIPYKSGITIATAQELESFMKAQGAYADRSASYILTENINLSGRAAVAYSTAPFSGTLDGDYHTIIGMQNQMFETLQGRSETDRAEIKNIIGYNMTFRSSSTDYEKGSGGIFGSLGGHANFTNIFLVESNLTGFNNTGYLMGRPNASIKVERTGSAGGSVQSFRDQDASLGGLVGYMAAGSNAEFYNIFSIGTKLGRNNVDNNGMGGFLGATSVKLNVRNAFVSIDPTYNIERKRNVAPLIGYYPVVGSVITNGYYNLDVISKPQSSYSNTYGTASNTKAMTGDGLKAGFDANDAGVWTYERGYFPMLSWLMDDATAYSSNAVNIAYLYAATTGAFTSRDNSTTLDQLFNGEIYGALQVPKKLNTAGFTYRSSDPSVLKVTEGGTILPLKKGTATLTIRYDDAVNGGFAENSYDFTVKATVTPLESITLNGNAYPGETLTANAAGAQDITYQWYRRKSGDTQSSAISGATSSTYTIQPTDAGYEINVEATAPGCAAISSRFTGTVKAQTPEDIEVSTITDRSLSVRAKGTGGVEYEYAYASSENGDKILAGRSKEKLTITGLSRNTNYWLFARAAGAADGTYEAGAWSKAVTCTTEKTEITGPIRTNDVTHMGDEILAKIADTNLQKGTWKLYREKADAADEDITALGSAGAYTFSYTIREDDVGCSLRFVYEASGDFRDPKEGAVTYTSAKILKKKQDKPTAPVAVVKDDHTIGVTISGTDHYDIGYTLTPGQDIKILDNAGNGYAGEQEIKVDGLSQNRIYYVYARLHEKAAYEPGAWSDHAMVKTKQTPLDENNTAITISGKQTVAQELTFHAKGTQDDTAALSGIWVLERIDADNHANTLLGTVDSLDANTIRYTLQPEDAGYRICATYRGNGDYEGSYSTVSDVIQEAVQKLGTITTSLSDLSQYTISLLVEEADEKTATFEFGYRRHDEETDIESNHASVIIGKKVIIQNLTANTTYDFYVRKAAKIGYQASRWEKLDNGTITTRKALLNGNIAIVSDAQDTSVNTTLRVSYVPGTYPDAADDTDSGHWQWYLGDTPQEAPSGTGEAFTIPPVDGNPNVRVRYIADPDSDFDSFVERSFGAVFKNTYPIPDAVEVHALAEDAKALGSVLRITTKESDLAAVYYYIQPLETDALPKLEKAESVDASDTGKADPASTANTGHWFKASEAQMVVRVSANQSYVVYAARLESKGFAASSLRVSEPVTSAKEPLNRTNEQVIEEADPNIAWKSLQEKTVRFHIDHSAPSVTWSYYVAADKDATVWQNIDADMLERDDGVSDDGSYAYSTAKLPLKYSGQYLKITMRGIQDYTGTLTYITKHPLEGAALSGKATLKPETEARVLATLHASYDGTDERNGAFTWYRQKVDAKGELIGEAEAIKTDGAGTSAAYTVTPKDIGYHIFARYLASAGGRYVGSVETDHILIEKKAQQIRPDAPALVRVNGNSIQFKAPSNHLHDGAELPQVRIGYLRYADGKPVDDAGNALVTQEDIEAAIQWQSRDEIEAKSTWFTQLHRDSTYRLFAQYLSTAAYEESMISEAGALITTQHALFDEDSLHVQTFATMSSVKTRISDIGSGIMISYSGDGYAEGELQLHRSNGEEIRLEPSKIEQDAGTQTVRYTYTYTGDDVGTSLIARFQAKADAKHYQGSVEKPSGVIVTKPQNPNVPQEAYRTLQRNFDTDLILTKVHPGYEYYLSSSRTAVPKESDWDTLQAQADGSYDFTGLERLNKYYLWTRIAETKEYDVSEAVCSEGLSPEPFTDFKVISLSNETDGKTPPTGKSELIAFPTTLKKGTLKLVENKLEAYPDGIAPDAERVTVDHGHAVSDFVKKDGTATDLVYEKGSTWGDRNAAMELVFYDTDKKELQRIDGRQQEVTVTADTAYIQLILYRVNAMTQTDLVWEAMLEDSSEKKVTAKLKAEIEADTQIAMIAPLKIQLNKEEQVLKQSTNNEQAINKSKLPIEFSIDEQVSEKDPGVPSLKGRMEKTTYYEEIKDGEAYIKCANDGSSFTKLDHGAWMDTGLSQSTPHTLMRLGTDAVSSYYFTGITSKEQIWHFDEEAQIREAYKFRFLVRVAEQDIRIGAKKLYE